MNHDPKSLAVALNANIEYPPDGDHVYDRIIYRFEDSRLRYQLHLQPTTGSAILAFDPTEPMQGCPMLEFSFFFTEVLIGTSAYDVHGKEVAIGFYQDKVTQAGHRLTLTWIPEGYWYVWADATVGSLRN